MTSVLTMGDNFVPKFTHSLGGYIQLDEYVAHMRCSACDEFGKFAKVEAACFEGESLSLDNVRKIYDSAFEKVCTRFKDDCHVLVNTYAGLRETIDMMEAKELKKIKDAIIAEHDIPSSEFDGNGQITKIKLKSLL